MIFWKLNLLEEKLAKNELSELAAVYYVIFNISIWTITYYIAADVNFNWYTIFEIIASILILSFSIKHCYTINLSIDGENFFSRFFSLYFVITLKTIALIIGVGLIGLAIVNPDLNTISMDFTPWFNLVITAVVQCTFYGLMIRSFLRIKKKITQHQ